MARYVYALTIPCRSKESVTLRLGMLGNASYLSKLDANSRYWQIEIQEDCRHLTTFITPFGRFLCNRLPFGISSAPEIFQQEMQVVLGELPGVVCQFYGELRLPLRVRDVKAEEVFVVRCINEDVILGKIARN